LTYDETPDTAYIIVCLGGVEPRNLGPIPREMRSIGRPPVETEFPNLDKHSKSMYKLYNRLTEAGLGETYEATHARLALDCIAIVHERRKLQSEGKIQQLPELPQVAADKSYVDTALKLCNGLENVIKSYSESRNPEKKRIYQLCIDYIE
jgi:hypothetical protein